MNENEFSIFVKCIDELRLKYKDIDNTGKCFKVSFNTCVFLHEHGIHTDLVHANITMDNEILGHAWLEYDNIVIDLTQHPVYWVNKINEYYEMAKIEQSIKYSGKELQNLILLNGNKVVWESWIVFQD